MFISILYEGHYNFFGATGNAGYNLKDLNLRGFCPLSISSILCWVSMHATMKSKITVSTICVKHMDIKVKDIGI